MARMLNMNPSMPPIWGIKEKITATSHCAPMAAVAVVTMVSGVMFCMPEARAPNHRKRETSNSINKIISRLVAIFRLNSCVGSITSLI